MLVSHIITITDLMILGKGLSQELSYPPLLDSVLPTEACVPP